MICDNCKMERIETDFIKNQKFCYKCEYHKKFENMPKRRIPKPKFCRMCSKEVIQDKALKQKQRTVFCSEECAKEGHRQLTSNYWTKYIQARRVNGF